MVRKLIVPLCGVLAALSLAGCMASPLYVPSSHRGTVGEIPRDGNGEPLWASIPRPLYAAPAPIVPPAPGIAITGPGVAEMRPRPVPPPPIDAPPVAAPLVQAPPVRAPQPTGPVPITGPGVAEMRTAPPVYAPQQNLAPAAAAPATGYPTPAGQPMYPASPRSGYILSPLSPDASKSEIRKRARDRRRACAHLRDCPADIRP